MKRTARMEALLAELTGMRGWYVLYERDRGIVLFRWLGEVRQELSIVVDRSGRLVAWSVWHNRREVLVQEVGVADRLDEWVGANR